MSPDHRRPHAWGFAVLGLCVLCGLLATAVVAGEPDTGLLWRSASANLPQDQGRAVRRTRTIELDDHALQASTSHPDITASVSLFDGLTLQVTFATIDRRTAANFTATGRILDDPGGTFILAVEDEAVVVLISSPNHGTYEIRRAPDASVHVLREIDAMRLGDCACGPHEALAPLTDQHQQAGPRLPVRTAKPEQRSEDPKPTPCDSTIDVMVVYTPRVRNSLGSHAAARALAYASIASLNIAFENSQVTALARLVHVDEVNYQESNSMVTDLFRLRFNGDGFLDEVHPWREEHGADLVSLLVDSLTAPCGVAYQMTEPSPSFRDFAFSVVQHYCALPNLVFAHELGHNLGCQHDHTDASLGVFPYSKGYRFMGQSGREWRTVMAASPGTRLPIFSNPRLLFDGVPTGVPEGQPQPADNARSLNNIAPIAHQFMSKTGIDCNNNGIPDSCDIMLGTSLDLNQNGIPDECDALPCPPDRLAHVLAGDSLSSDHFGSSIAMSDDRLVVGAPRHFGIGVHSGAAYVFRRQGDAWRQEAKLTPNDTVPHQFFGNAVAISPGGEFVLVGAHRDGFLISDVGAVYVFQRQAEQWVQEVKLANPDPEQGDWFGWSIAVGGMNEADLHAVIAAPFDNHAAINAGAIYVIRRSATGWGSPLKLVANDAQNNDRFGWSVSASRDGAAVIAGAPLADGDELNSGAAYIFQRHGETWSAPAKLVPQVEFAEGRYGWSVGIDGDRAIVGVPGDGVHGFRAGAVEIFQQWSAQWNRLPRLHAADAGSEKRFGAAVAIRGNVAVIGSVLDVVNGAASGSAILFRNDDGEWRQQAKLAPIHAAPYDNLGHSVAVSPDALRAAAAAHFDDHSGAVDAGSVYVFSTAIARPDCNGNGIPDDCDIANGTSADRNQNGIPDECEAKPCIADVSPPGGDVVVNVNDLLFVINQWGPCPPNCPFTACPADITSDCLVNVNDLLQVINHWGECR